jgi:hypothetical protein
MNSSRSDKTWQHVLVALGALGIALGLDRATLALRTYAMTTFDFRLSIPAILALPVVSALIVLGLVWYLFGRGGSPSAALVFLAAGLIGMLFYGSLFVPLPDWLRLQALQSFRANMSQIGGGSMSYFVACFLAVAGAAGLIRNKT